VCQALAKRNQKKCGGSDGEKKAIARAKNYSGKTSPIRKEEKAAKRKRILRGGINRKTYFASEDVETTFFGNVSKEGPSRPRILLLILVKHRRYPLRSRV